MILQIVTFIEVTPIENRKGTSKEKMVKGHGQYLDIMVFP